MVTGQFLDVGSNIITIDSLVPQGNDTEYNVQIQTLDAYGYTQATYVWVPGEDVGEEKNCWTDEDMESKVLVDFAPGQGLWVFADSTDQTLQSAGKVGTSDVSVQLRRGAIGVGNPFPVAIDLQDIVPVGDDTEYNVQIQTLDAYGYTLETYVWVPGEDVGEEESCWTDEDMEAKVTGITFLPGQGLWVFADNDSQYLRFPAPEL